MIGMKVLFTFYNPSGGMETLNRTRCRALMNRGVECHLLYTHPGAGVQNIRGIPTLIAGKDGEIRERIQKEQYDLIVVCTDIDLARRIRGFGYGGPLVFEIQGLGPLQEAEIILKDMSERIHQCADALLYPKTTHLQQLLTRRFAGIPAYCFDDPVDASEFAYRSYPAKPFPILGWVGRLQANKNWSEFLKIGSRLLNIRPEMYLWIFHDEQLYDPGDKEQFSELAEALGITSRIIMYSNVPHELMADYLSMIGDSGGLLCSTSILEGFGYAVAEAMLCRCPVLSSDSDGIRRMIRHNRTGRLYNRGSIDDAVEGALDLLQSGKRRERIRLEGERHIRETLSPDLYADRFLKMAKKLGVLQQ